MRPLSLTLSPSGRHLAPRPTLRRAGFGVAGLAVLATAAATLPLSGGTAEAMRSTTTRTFVPVADVTVSGASNYQNFNDTDTLEAEASPIVRSYLKFTVSGTAGTNVRARLRLFSQSTSPSGVSVSRVVGNGWTESQVFANAYAIGRRVTTSDPVSANKAVDIDLGSAITGDGTYSFVLTTASTEKLSFASRETKRPPRLVVSSTNPPSSASPTASPEPLPVIVDPTPLPTVLPTTPPVPTTSPTPSPTSVPVPVVTPPAPTGRALHIHHGFDLASPSQIAQHASLIDSRPIDGVTVNLPTLSNDTLSSVAHSESEYAAALSPMPRLSRVTHNFVVVRTMHPLDWYSDATWTTISRNFGNLARAAAAKGQFDGIFFDTEFYGSGTYPWNFGQGSSPWVFSATGGATPGHSASDAQATVSGRGRQTGDAIAAAWPAAFVMSTYGPWVGETKTSSTGGWGAFGYNDTSWTNELMGSFTGGIGDAAAAHAGLTYVDGGEIYQAHSAAEYATAYRWEKSGLAASSSVVLRDPAAYARTVSAGFGVYDKDMRISGWPTMGATQWQSVLTNALRTADRYVWSYSEAYDWLATGWPTTPVPSAILTATSNAMTAAAG
ncbi:MAG TPA: hypothetical protein VMZ11_01000 [Mycobacteriales bacterium]|nr:hypothetical protein [Mycobacteriales bacterium]